MLTSNLNKTVGTSETSEGWPLLAVETEVNGDSKKTNEKGSFLVVHWACASTRDLCFALAALAGPVQNILYFNSFVPAAQQAGQATVLGRLSLIVCLWSGPILQLPDHHPK